MDRGHPISPLPEPSYAGRRILEAMRSAHRYADALYARVRAAAVGREAAMLEFGAGDGVFVERFLRDGCTVSCVEPDARNRELLRGLGARVVGDVGELSDASVDFVYTVNVLEHLVDLERCLNEINRVLRPGGRLFVFVPAFNVLWTSLDDEVRHVQRFTRRSLVAAIEGAQFKVENSYYFDSLGFVAALGVRLLERGGLFRYSPVTVGFYDKFLLPISKVGDLVLFWLLGKNVVAVARKP